MNDYLDLDSEADNAVKEMFANRVCDPLEWFKHSRSLLAAARLTSERAAILIDPFEKSDLENVACMLYGFSLENLLKAQWALKRFGPSHADGWTPVAAFPAELKTHDLVKLARLSCPAIAQEYEHPLAVLSDSATWSGRYPCSLKGDDGTIIRYPGMTDAAEEIFKLCSREFTALS